DAGVLVALDVRLIEDLHDGGQAELPSRPHDQLEALAQRLAVGGAESLPAAVGTGAVLDDASPERPAPRLLHHAGGVHDLPLALHRARPRDEHQIVAAARDLADPHRLEDWTPGTSLLRDALVGARDRDDLLDARQLRDLALRQLGDVAVDADQGDLLTLQLPGLEAEVVQLALDGLYLVCRGVASHLDQHDAQWSPNAARAVKGAHGASKVYGAARPAL